MSSMNKSQKEGLRCALTELPVAVATLGVAALLLLSLYKNDFAAWVFIALFTVIGCGACVFFFMKTLTVYKEAKEAGYAPQERPLLALILAIAETAVAILASVILLIVTLCKIAF